MAVSQPVHPAGLAHVVALLAAQVSNDCPADERLPSGECPKEGAFTAQQRQRVEITSEPSGARVSLDDQPLGLTPLVVKQRLKAGKHRLRIALEGHVEIDEEIVIQTFDRHSFARKLTPFPRVIFVEDETTKGAAVRIDDVVIGAIPLSHVLTPGTHLLRVELDGYNPWTLRFPFKAGETYPISPVLVPKLGVLSVQTDLEQVPVTIAEVGGSSPPISTTAPFSGLELRPGRYSLTFEVSGAAPMVEERSVTQGNNEVQIALTQGAYYSPVFSADETKIDAICDDPSAARDAVLPSEAAQTAACLEVGWRYQNGISGYSRNHDLAKRYLKMACDRGSGAGCESVGWLEREEVQTTKTSTAEDEVWRAYYGRACVLKARSACYRLHRSWSQDGRDDPSRPYVESLLPRREVMQGSIGPVVRMGFAPGEANGWLGFGGINIAFGFPVVDWFAVGFEEDILFGPVRYSRINDTLPGTERVWSFAFSIDAGLRAQFYPADRTWFVHIGAKLDINWLAAPHRVLFALDGSGSVGVFISGFDVRLGVASRALPEIIDRFQSDDDKVGVLSTTRRLTVFGQIGFAWDLD